LALAEFIVNNKAYLATKFIANYGRELRMEVNIRRKKNRKGIEICGENEKSSERGRSSIKEGIGRNEVVSR